MPVSVTVVGLGCELDRLFSGQRPALPVPAPPGRDDLRDLFEAVGGPLRGGERVIVVVGDWLPAETLERVHTVRSPSAGALAAALGAVEDQLLVLAWVGSVAGLRHPAVSLLHHARSALPWSSFGVGLQPEAFLQPLARGSEDLPLEPPEEPIELLVAPSESADLDWIVEDVVPALGGVPVRQIPATLHGPAWWGTSRLVEGVGVPTDLGALADSVLPHHVVPCRWCGEPIAAPPCPFCGDAGSSGAPPHTQHRSPVGTLAKGESAEQHKPGDY